MILKLAWRNLWRNKRRTFITMASVAFAVILAVTMRSFQIGTYARIVDNLVGSYTGFVQIHEKGYWDDQTIDNVFPMDDSLVMKVRSTEGVTGLVPRLESFALASSYEATKGMAVIGIDPEAEDKMTALKDKVVVGEYLASNDDGILIGTGVAEYLTIGVGDTLVLLGQGYHGVSAAGKYPVRGIVKFGAPEMNERMVYLSLVQTQQLFGAPNMLTSLSLNIDDVADSKLIAEQITQKIDTAEYEVMPWEELLPELQQTIEADNGSSLIMIGILYMIIGFGMFGTMLMMLAEREYEFGILVSIGMKQLKLGITVVLESVIIGLLGTALGFALSIPVVAYYTFNPILLTGGMAESYEGFGFEPVMVATLDPWIFVSQTILVLILTLALAIYPLVAIYRIDHLKATRR